MLVSTEEVSRLPPHSEDELASRVRAKAVSLGFDAVAFARADVPLDEEMRRYEAFLDAEMQGAMSYLSEHREVRARLDTKEILEGARSVVCLARRYQRDPAAEAADPPLAQLVARYARGQDYHNFLRRKLRRLAAYLRTLSDEGGAPARARPLCDDAPVLERAWAARAGLGFIGKNGLLIVPGVGSFVLLGEVVTTLVLPETAPMEGRCGACTRCLDACPTGAFPRPFVLDPRRCISYLTIELRGASPVHLREATGDHLFGCDDCQTSCPFNASERPRDRRGLSPFEPGEAMRSASLVGLLSGGTEGWDAFATGSPLKRATADGLARNAAVVLGNRREVAALPELTKAAEHHASPVVREAAGWAIRRCEV
jgi:epoxyqueuosine reductase